MFQRHKYLDNQDLIKEDPINLIHLNTHDSNNWQQTYVRLKA